ncbi:MAG: hypothetical protein Q9182_005416 [Xanthomendoza sp. 2 TL-2023]
MSLTARNLQPWCRYFLSSRGCRAGDECPFLHDLSRLEQVQHGTSSAGISHPSPNLGGADLHFAQDQSTGTGVDRTTYAEQHGRRYRPPPVDASRVVQKPVSRLQKDHPREHQIGQLERRFSAARTVKDDGSSLAFQLVPSDPDFPFELSGLDCVLDVPENYPRGGRPSLAVKNRDIPRGYAINVERGFDALIQATPQATLLSLINTLDKQLEALLTAPKAETIKIVSNANKFHAQQPSDTQSSAKAEKPRTEEPHFTPDQRRNADARRRVEVGQLEARLGRLPLFSESSDGIVFTVPISPRKPSELPVSLQAIQSIQLFVPLLYPLHPCRIEIPGVNKEVATKTERGFNIQTRESRGLSLMAHINHFAQHMHTMATEPDLNTPDPDQSSFAMEGLYVEEKEKADEKTTQPEDDRNHIHIIPRPPEWTMGAEDDTGTDSDSSDSYDSGDDVEEGQEDTKVPDFLPESHSTPVAERGVSLNFPSLELHNIELLELPSLSLSIKCTRCKTSTEIANLRPSAARGSSCPKCAQPCSLSFRPEPMHINSFRAGYLDLIGCTITDMLPSTFVPTCATCSTAVPAPGVVSVRGDSASIAICRECHGRLTFKIPETKFTLVSNASLHPRHLLPLRRKTPKENLGIVAGEELPRKGRCRHYMKSYRWFRFSCCSKVYRCDKCHDEEEAHPNEHANRMICGFCSREQNYRPEDCGVCRAVVVGKKATGFWEGGKGTRDKGRMSRKDPRKYKRRPGTRVGGPNKGGIGGGGETAKKAS